MYKSLQTCRGLAALFVVLYHARGAISQPKYFGESALGLAFIFGGSVGVDFFFVLSGFIIVWIHARDLGQPHRLGAYLAKRAMRIYPTYWIIFAFVCCVALAVPSLRSTVPDDAWMLIKALLLLPMGTSGMTATGAPVLTVAWSLQFEVMFYLFVAVAIVSPRLCLLVAALWAWNFATCIGGCQFPLSFFSDFRILLFALGGATAWLCRATAQQPVENCRRSLQRIGPPTPWVDSTVLVLGVVLFIAAATWEMLGIAYAVPLGQKSIVTMYGVASALVIFGAVKAEDRGVVRGKHAAWQLLGGASYALYLMHYPIVSLVVKLAILLGLHGVGGALLALVAATSVAVAAAVLFHLHVEQPMLRALGAWRLHTLRTISSPKT
jgi:exopolysaccharide production protein ExoZ